MKAVTSVLGWSALVLGGLLSLLGLLSLPAGGLMFAFPFVFLFPGLFLAGLGALLLRAGTRSGDGGKESAQPPIDTQRGDHSS